MTPSGPKWTGEVRLIPAKLSEPISRKKPTRYFVNSMSDLFHEKLTNAEIATVFAVMAQCPQRIFQILNKRPERALEWFRETVQEQLPNVWLGVSCEDQSTANERIPLLLKCRGGATDHDGKEPGSITCDVTRCVLSATTGKA